MSMTERCQELLRKMNAGERPTQAEMQECLNDPVTVGDRTIPFGTMTPDDLRQWAREERARAYQDYTSPSAS